MISPVEVWGYVEELRKAVKEGRGREAYFKLADKLTIGEICQVERILDPDAESVEALLDSLRSPS